LYQHWIGSLIAQRACIKWETFWWNEENTSLRLLVLQQPLNVRKELIWATHALANTQWSMQTSAAVWSIKVHLHSLAPTSWCFTVHNTNETHSDRNFERMGHLMMLAGDLDKSKMQEDYRNKFVQKKVFTFMKSPSPSSPCRAIFCCKSKLMIVWIWVTPTINQLTFKWIRWLRY
jgi:hypothetical protein